MLLVGGVFILECGQIAGRMGMGAGLGFGAGFDIRSSGDSACWSLITYEVGDFRCCIALGMDRGCFE